LPDRKNTKSSTSSEPVFYDLIVPDRNGHANTPDDLVNFGPSLSCGGRCHACGAEANRQSDFNNANRHVMTYSEAVKMQNSSSPSSSKSSPNSHELSTPVSGMKCLHELRTSNDKEISSSSNDGASNLIRRFGTGSGGNGSESVHGLRTSSMSSKSKPLRAEAASFVPDWASKAPNANKTDIEETVKGAYEHYGPTHVELLTPNCPKVGSQNGLHLTMANFEGDKTLHQAVYGNEFNMTNYIPEQDCNQQQQNPWCTLTPHKYDDQDVLGNDEYKVQTADPEQAAEQTKCKSESINSSPSPRRLSIAFLKRMNDQMSTRIIEAQIAEQLRTRKDLEHGGAGPYPHTTSSTSQPITENMWMPPISPGHQYTSLNVIPNPRSREWEELASAIKLINLENSHRSNCRPQKWWEPPIPMGFERRTRFNQPPRSSPSSTSSSPSPNAGNEWDWVNIPFIGCTYCGGQGHVAGDCITRRRHIMTNTKHCLNCNGQDHRLCECLSLPVFDYEYSRAKKMKLYAHTEHWRQVLHRQHAMYVNEEDSTAAAGDCNEYPERLHPGIGDPSAAFSWLNCTPCTPEAHWAVIQSNVSVIQGECEGLAAEKLSSLSSLSSSKENNEDVDAYWETPEWLLEYKNCPVVWNLMHKQEPNVTWAVFNPFNSVAVDAFWRTGMKAMG
jgi:hypothetical protein